MSTETRPRIFKGIIDIFKELGNTNTIEYDEVVTLHPALVAVLESIENGKIKAAATESINTNGGSKKGKGGIRKKYEAPTMAVEEMTPQKLEEMIKTLNGKEKEIGD